MTRRAALCALLLGLAACGQTGPLYLPAETVTAPSASGSDDTQTEAEATPENDDDDEEAPAS